MVSLPETAPGSSISELIREQQRFFATGATRPLPYRLQQLAALERAIAEMECALIEALREDLGRPTLESLAAEIAMVQSEIRYVQRNLPSWVQPRKVGSRLLHYRAQSWIVPEPLGRVLIIGPWNFPVQLTLMPLIGAIAAGNCAIVKPSEQAPRTSAVIARLLGRTFPQGHVAAVEGEAALARELLEQPFDHIFFTGGAAVGRLVMEAAAKHLTPVTLELGGKSPCIVDDDIQLAYTARRIAWGKCFNAGQSCVAPDYLLVKEEVRDALVQALIEQIQAFFGHDPRSSSSYGRIVNARHWHRLAGLLREGTIVHGGDAVEEERYIAPTIIVDPPLDGRLMQEEIFGPILPVLTYRRLSEAISFVNERPKPLALYYFSRDEARQQTVLEETSSGGVCFNDVVVQLDNHELPFGGVGASGMGAYHGKASFDTFSHARSVTRRTMLFDLELRYPPYEGKLELVKRLLRIF